MDPGDTKLFAGKRKTEFNIYDRDDPTLFETTDLIRNEGSSLISPKNVRRGMASQLDGQKQEKTSNKLETEVITRFNVPSNVVTRESQAVDNELKEPKASLEMSKKKSLSQFSFGGL